MAILLGSQTTKNIFVTVAVKSNVLAKSCSGKNVAEELSNWCGNARDRGDGRRPLAVRQQNTSATAAATAEENKTGFTV
jgi:hypothetical protein